MRTIHKSLCYLTFSILILAAYSKNDDKSTEKSEDHSKTSQKHKQTDNDDDKNAKKHHSKNEEDETDEDTPLNEKYPGGDDYSDDYNELRATLLGIVEKTNRTKTKYHKLKERMAKISLDEAIDFLGVLKNEMNKVGKTCKGIKKNLTISAYNLAKTQVTRLLAMTEEVFQKGSQVFLHIKKAYLKYYAKKQHNSKTQGKKKSPDPSNDYANTSNATDAKTTSLPGPPNQVPIQAIPQNSIQPNQLPQGIVPPYSQSPVMASQIGNNQVGKIQNPMLNPMQLKQLEMLRMQQQWILQGNQPYAQPVQSQPVQSYQVPPSNYLPQQMLALPNQPLTLPSNSQLPSNGLGGQ